MTALILLLIPAAILAIFLAPKSKSDIPDDVTVGAGDFFGEPLSEGESSYWDHDIARTQLRTQKAILDELQEQNALLRSIQR